MLSFQEVSKDSAPESLLDLCSKYVVSHLDTICFEDPESKGRRLKDGLTLPSEICEKLLEVYQQTGHSLEDKFVKIFENKQATRLRRVRLRNAKITDYGLCILLHHRLIELDLCNCIFITKRSLAFINEFGDSLLSLVIGPSVNILHDTLHPDSPEEVGESSSSPFFKRGYIIKAPNLRRLAVRNLNTQVEVWFFRLLVQSLHNLTHLDLSGCYDLDDLSYLCELNNLTSLILHNVRRLQETIGSICLLKKLRHLDISQSNEKHGTFMNENQTLALLVESLPMLSSLDISGTNLAGTGVAEHSPAPKTQPKNGYENVAPQTDIPGLSSRVDNPLDFLGLYATHHGACHRHDIPAKKISGDANEDQILTAAAAYIDRPEVLQKVLNDLYHLFRYETCQNVCHALTVVLEAMDRHIHEKHIQISGSATLFYIVKGKDKHSFAMRMKRKIICTLLNGMSTHRDDDTMMRNGCLTLCQFKIPQDVLFDYKRLILILLHIVWEMEQEGFVQRIGIYLLNSLACQVDGYQKQLLGDLGAIKKMLDLIEDRLERKICDDVLEVAWSTMWNVTDETAINCERFLDGRGMDFFLGCLSTFPQKEELLRNMMGLLGNVAEVKNLRSRLMTSHFVSVFSDLLDSCSDGIEVSYNAAGVLSHMASDGPDVWTITSPRREDVLRRMVSAIERWDLTTERNINYRSFEPIMYLVQVYHTPECQHWAVWALANLTRVYPTKYCSLVEAEGGLTLLEEVISHSEPYPRIKELAAMVIEHCQQYNRQSQASKGPSGSVGKDSRGSGGAAPGSRYLEPPLEG
ncbi:protein zer-1 homolog [Ischnura elegans]|uniref:protein zer-1 homolog n=1 Tax=Ischnura elegans TaxID=197161 RepID=UPI001ED86FEC|nr:protein zer-1 homolog [Ischnura elegans]XP_046386515.1 protein zer-1 homolog [Ischnura elegans]XP_046386522.1 protein zer-1 homolog [Ischnura elegans]